MQHGFLPDTPAGRDRATSSSISIDLPIRWAATTSTTCVCRTVAWRVIVADVVGKGVAAALLMAKLSAEARFCLASGGNAAQAVTMLNERLCRLHLDRFVTAVMVLLDPRRARSIDRQCRPHGPDPAHRDGEVTEPGVPKPACRSGLTKTSEYEET